MLGSCRKWICVLEHVERERDSEEKEENKHKYLPRLFGETWNRKNEKSARYFKLENGKVVRKIS